LVSLSFAGANTQMCSTAVLVCLLKFSDCASWVFQAWIFTSLLGPLFASLSSDLSTVFCVSLVVSRCVFKKYTLTLFGRGHHVGCFVCLGVNLGQRPNISREILRLPFTPPMVAVFGPSVWSH
jgi:hypothetical protein